MNERPKPGADPDATVIRPAGGADHAERAADPDATVMIPATRMEDEDATVMMPAVRADDDATVMIPAPGPDDDATVMISPRAEDDATVMLPAAAPDPDATVMIPLQAPAEPDPEATIAIPTPGRRRVQPATAASMGLPPASGGASKQPEFVDLGGINALVAAANPVLVVVTQFRHTLMHPDPGGLMSSLLERVDAFENAARAAGRDDAIVASASIALCALVDESAGSTPWGGDWVESGLLWRKHGEKSGGEAFFRLLEEKSGEPGAPGGRKDLLEFLYVCLALGFEGRYRQEADGREALLGLRARLLDRLRELRPPRDGELSGHWRGEQAPARRPAGAIGFWAAGAAAAGLLAALYAGFSISLGGMSDPVARELAQLKAPAAGAPPRTAGAAQTPRIAERLAAEIGRGEVAVIDAAGMSTIVIRSDRLFGSGSARLETAIEPVVQRLAEALDQTPGAILITGHTDDVPIRTARFPSNWELSTQRAASVMALMAARLKEPARLRAEGLADSSPAVPNDSAANRARNRRVEVVLRSSP